MGTVGKTGVDQEEGTRIVISEIRDREDAVVPSSALKSIVQRISQSMGELGLKANIEASEY